MIIEKGFSYKQCEDIKKIVNSEINNFRKYIKLNEMDNNVTNILKRLESLEIKIQSMSEKIEVLENSMNRERKSILKKFFVKKMKNV
jgi:hypothetical protein